MDYLDKAEKALEYLKTSEDEYAKLKSLVKVYPDRSKQLQATLYFQSDEKTVEGRKQWTLAHTDMEEFTNSMQTIIEEYELISERRKRAETTIEMYRSVNSAMKRGNI